MGSSGFLVVFEVFETVEEGEGDVSILEGDSEERALIPFVDCVLGGVRKEEQKKKKKKKKKERKKNKPQAQQSQKHHNKAQP